MTEWVVKTGDGVKEFDMATFKNLLKVFEINPL